MSDKYTNEKGVRIETHTDKRGIDHISFYDNDPEDDHSSIHINYNSETGEGKIVDTTSGTKETTSVKCYLTTACMKHLRETFDDNCYELTMLRWFRDNFVSKEDKEHYYITAPIIVEALDNIPDNDDIYEHIYQSVIIKCIEDIKAMNYESAYSRYKNMVLTLEEQFARPALEQRLVGAIKKKVLV